MKTEKALSLMSITKNFKGKTVLSAVNLEVEQGEVVGIVGRNGSGKTTLLRIIMGLIYPNQGEVKVCAQTVTPGFLGKLPTRVGALIETPVFLGQFSGLQNLQLLASIRNEITKVEVRNMMVTLGLDPDSRMPVSKYSLGMRQRLGIAQAIMEKPSLVLFDEPTNGLDTEGLEIFIKIIDTMKQQGVSFIVVSHRSEEIERLCTKVYRIENGTLSQQTTI